MSHALFIDNLSQNSCIIYWFSNRLYNSEVPSGSLSKRVSVSLICMKINWQVRFIAIRMVSHGNLFTHWGRENSEMVNLSRNWEKNEQLCQKSWNLVTPTGDYAAAMVTLKVVNAQLNNEISARDDWTAPESFNVVELIPFLDFYPPPPHPLPSPFQG